MILQETYTLSNGLAIPKIGLGTWLSVNDERFGPYLFEQAGTDEDRELMKTGIRSALQGGEEGLYKTFCAQMKVRAREAGFIHGAPQIEEGL